MTRNTVHMKTYPMFNPQDTCIIMYIIVIPYTIHNNHWSSSLEARIHSLTETGTLSHVPDV